MSKKVLILGIVVMLIVGGVATYCRVDYSQAQNCLTRSRLAVEILEKHLDQHDDVAHLKELHNSAKIEVGILEHTYDHSFWINRDEIWSLKTALEKDGHDIDQLALDANKRKSDPSSGWLPK